MTGSCPEHMVMGPCGGVRADGTCEVLPRPCVFPEPVPWPGPANGPVNDPVEAARLPAVPLVLADFSSEPFSAPALTSQVLLVRATAAKAESEGRP